MKRKNITTYNRKTSYAFIMLFAVIGTIMLINSKAAPGDNIIEPENGTVASPATTVTDATASNGKAVLFSTQPAGITGNWSLKMSDEFNGTSLNKTMWTPGWFSTGISGPVNDLEKACYSPNQLKMPGDGSLHMLLGVQQNTCKATYPNTGALISSNPLDYVSGHTGYQYAYGVVEWRVYLTPDSNGNIANWPGVWSNGQNWPNDGENDTMEGLGGSACYHFHSTAGGPGGCASGKYAGWHTFASNWQPGSVKYYYDGVYVGQITTGITSSPQYLIVQQTTDLQTAIASEILIDYVRVWQ